MRYLLVAIAILNLPASAQAWSKAGHMVSAAIGHAVLKQEHPQSIAKAIAILKQHPQYESRWVERLADIPNLSAEDKDIYLLMLAARWPDDIRSEDEHHHGDWHFINLPYQPAGRVNGVQPPPPRDDNIIRAFELNRGRAKSGPPAERAIALCWVLHLIGDCHQPLHTSSLYSAEYPKGDKGGNIFYVRVKTDSSPINLHSFWDDLIVGSDRFQTTRNLAIELRLRPAHAKAKLTELRATAFEHWVKNESFKLVDEVVYRRGKLAGATERDKAPLLPDDYIKVTKPVAERRVVLAGYRIADVIHHIVE